ncbi:predicted protein [Naegleria gruberi]|uniref:Predicted protein n=1 Tax=Naegleria gruberi TaxID=5762 RepID=D2VAV9_NAEGR|nr:uncharacterized protein NAEGRDRAFT_65995 [Naegleria gruberi]EFC46149.1 predicted protein [Naegleria gruberi]|eukprot:XP_002678893.1 predicted protein [Naegleria gruberi strain NEG-M]
MYRFHSKEELVSWTNRMRYFRFVRAYGGHANDGDTLLAKFSFETTQKVSEFLQSLGVHEGKDIINNKNFTEDGFWRDLRNRDSIFLWITKEPPTVTLHVQNKENCYEVKEDEVVRAIEIESLLDEFTEKSPINPPKPSNLCFCKENYPEEFESK